MVYISWYRKVYNLNDNNLKCVTFHCAHDSQLSPCRRDAHPNANCVCVLHVKNTADLSHQ